MGKIINEENVKIVVDGLELLKKYLEVTNPLNNIFRPLEHNVFDSKYSVQDIENLLKELKDGNNS
jgi:hypothetical protein